MQTSDFECPQPKVKSPPRQADQTDLPNGRSQQNGMQPAIAHVIPEPPSPRSSIGLPILGVETTSITAALPLLTITITITPASRSVGHAHSQARVHACEWALRRRVLVGSCLASVATPHWLAYAIGDVQTADEMMDAPQVASITVVLLATEAANADSCSRCIAACPLMQMPLFAC